MEKYNRMIRTLINSTEEKNELPGQILSFNADKLFSKQNKTKRQRSIIGLFVFVLLPFGRWGGHIYHGKDPQTSECNRITERVLYLFNAN